MPWISGKFTQGLKLIEMLRTCVEANAKKSSGCVNPFRQEERHLLPSTPVQGAGGRQVGGRNSSFAVRELAPVLGALVVVGDESIAWATPYLAGRDGICLKMWHARGDK